MVSGVTIIQREPVELCYRRVAEAAGTETELSERWRNWESVWYWKPRGESFQKACD